MWTTLPKPVLHSESYLTVFARKNAKEDASTIKHPQSAILFVGVMEDIVTVKHNIIIIIIYITFEQCTQTQF